MSSPATSSRRLREINARLVLERMFDAGPVTGSDLMAATGLSRATVHTVCDELIDLGWVAEVADQRTHGGYRMGRPARRYALDAGAGVVVGVDAGQHRVVAVVADLAEATLGSCQTPMHREAPAGERLAAVLTAVDGALAAAGREDADVLAAVVAVPAPVDRAGRTAFRGNAYWDRLNPDLVDHLPQARGWTTIVDNDANLAAIAETAHGHGRGVRDHVTVLVDEALGAGIVEDGRLLRGWHGGAGELRFLDLVAGVGSSEGVAPLATRGAAKALASAAGRRSSLRDHGPGPVDARAVLDAAAAGDRVAVKVVDGIGIRFTRVVAALAGIFDTRRIILAGELADRCGPVADRVNRDLGDYVDPPHPQTLVSELGPLVVARGAVRRALVHVRENALDIDLSA